MSANPVIFGAFRELKLLWWIRAPVQPLFFGDCEWTLTRTNHNTFDTLKASMMAGFADNEALRESKVMLGSC